ncbi:hypothetical protein [Tateyamaria sp. SN6-1]|uniref:hypothetical protein n=1 Tax=Tateyamaria sp. SN6-1 TaxID=3092148 RepID=UPI0039F54613
MIRKPHAERAPAQGSDRAQPLAADTCRKELLMSVADGDWGVLPSLERTLDHLDLKS